MSLESSSQELCLWFSKGRNRKGAAYIEQTNIDKQERNFIRRNVTEKSCFDYSAGGTAVEMAFGKSFIEKSAENEYSHNGVTWKLIKDGFLEQKFENFIAAEIWSDLPSESKICRLFEK